MKPIRKALARPGAISGSDTMRKVRQRPARSVWLASSIEGLMPSTTPISTRKEIGVKLRTCARCPADHRSSGRIPARVAPSITCVSVPVRPRSMISDRPTTKGGVMIGRIVSRRRLFLNGNAVRVATSANASPNAVVAVAVHSARNSVRRDAAGRAADQAGQAPDLVVGAMLRTTPSVVKLPSKS